MILLQIPVLVDSITDDGQFLGRTQWDAPDVDPMVFLSEPESNELPALAVGQMRLCEVDGTLLFDIWSTPCQIATVLGILYKRVLLGINQT